MRLRDKLIKTGELLTWTDPEDSKENYSILFLIQDIGDIKTLSAVRSACKDYLKSNVGWRWCSVADQRRLAETDPGINPANILRFEIEEFAGLQAKELKTLFEPALKQLSTGNLDIFPRAGGVGVVAEGVQFLSRQKELEKLKELIKANRGVLVRAPRRAGKTSILKRLASESQTGYNVFFMDLQRDRNMKYAVARLWSNKHEISFATARKTVEEKNWETALVQLMNSADKTSPPLLILDEIVWMLEHVENKEGDINSTLTGLSTVLESFEGSRLVLAGSTDFQSFIDRDDIGLEKPPQPFSELCSYRLPSLAEERLTMELRRVLLGTGIVPSKDDVAWLAENVDLALPYPGLLFLDTLYNTLRQTRTTLDIESLEIELRKFCRNSSAFAEYDSPTSQITECLTFLAKHPVGPIPFENFRSMLEARFPMEIKTILFEIPDKFPVVITRDTLQITSRIWHRWWREREGL